jgi:hypothetical protein
MSPHPTVAPSERRNAGRTRLRSGIRVLKRVKTCAGSAGASASRRCVCRLAQRRQAPVAAACGVRRLSAERASVARWTVSQRTRAECSQLARCDLWSQRHRGGGGRVGQRRRLRERVAAPGPCHRQLLKVGADCVGQRLLDGPVRPPPYAQLRQRKKKLQTKEARSVDYATHGTRRSGSALPPERRAHLLKRHFEVLHAGGLACTPRRRRRARSASPYAPFSSRAVTRMTWQKTMSASAEDDGVREWPLRAQSVMRACAPRASRRR